MQAILTAPVAVADDRGTGRVLIYRVVLGGYEEITSPDGTESWDEFVLLTEVVTVADQGPYTPVNRLIDLEVAARFPGYTCLESTYQGVTTVAAIEAEAEASPF